MKEMVENIAVKMAERRRELIAQPLSRIWDELAKAAVEAMLSPETMTAVRLRDDSGEAFLQRQMDRAMMDERRRCLSIVKAIDPHNEAEAHLIETIVRRIRGDE